MATTYNNLAQAQAAYDTILKQKQGVLRADEVRRNRALLGVDNYLKQQGISEGHAESIRLKANGMRSDTTDFDNQLINLAAIIQGFNSSRGGGRAPRLTAAQRLSDALGANYNPYAPFSNRTPIYGTSNASLGGIVRANSVRQRM